MKLRLLVAIFIWLIPTSVFAGDNKAENKEPQTLEEIDKDEARQNVSNHLNDLLNILIRSSEKKYTECLKAFGDHDFCQCVKNKTPSGISFMEYVTVTITPKEELGYSNADEEAKDLIDNALKAREICVETLK